MKKMFKVISPIPTRDGGRYWLRCGSAYTNKDESINIYVDALPVAPKEGLTLQLRELTEEDRRASAEKRATYQARGTLDPASLDSAPTGITRNPTGGFSRTPPANDPSFASDTPF